MRSPGLRLRLAAGDVLIGCLLAQNAPWLVDMLGLAGYDFVVIDLEHEPFDQETIPGLVRAADSVGMATIARLPCTDRVLPLLSTGVHGIQIPHLETTGQAEELVAMARFAPEGRRTYYATARFAEYGFGIDERELMRSVNEELLLIGMIETVRAVENLDELIEVEGIDAFHVGPLDLAQSMGFPSADELEEVIADVVAHALSTMHATISDHLHRAGIPGSRGAVVTSNPYLSAGSRPGGDGG
jgi:4-hydroxy-2-oxoheptanedioate aldolase